MSVAHASNLPVPGVSIRSTFRAEWTKVSSLRSTWITVAGAALLSLAFAAVVSATQVSNWDEMSESQRADVDPTSAALIGVLFATVIYGSLAVRSITSEYSTGMIRLTFSAIPGRRQVLVAKATILAALALPAVLAGNVVSFLVGQRVLAAKNAEVSLGDPGVPKAIVYGAVAVSVIAVLGVGLGAIIRRTAAATTVLAVALVGGQLFGIVLPETARGYLPGTALQAVVTVKPADDLLHPTTGLIVLAGYAVLVVVVAAMAIDRRDA